MRSAWGGCFRGKKVDKVEVSQAFDAILPTEGALKLRLMRRPVSCGYESVSRVREQVPDWAELIKRLAYASPSFLSPDCILWLGMR